MRQDAERAYLALQAYHWACFTMFGTAATLYRIRIAGLDPLELVLVGTALEVTVLAAEVPTGVVADVVSRRLSILIGFAIMGAGFAFEGTVTSLGPILAAQVVWGLGYTFTSGATQAWIAGEVGDDRAGDVLVRGAAWRRIGGLVGTAAGTAVGVVELRYALLASGAALTASMVWFAAAMRETSFERAEGRTTRLFAEILADGFRVVRGRLLLVAVLVVVVLEVVVVVSSVVEGLIVEVEGIGAAWSRTSPSSADHQVKAPTPRRTPPTSTPRNLTVEVIGQPG